MLQIVTIRNITNITAFLRQKKILKEMFKSAIVAALTVSAAAFSPALNVRPSVTRMSMGLVGSGSAEGLAGQTAPLGYFDPLGFSTGKTDGEIKKYREAELKHGRLAMIAFVGILVGENFNPLFDGKITGPAIYQFQQADDLVSFFWVGVLFLIALIEGNNILNGWESSGEINSRSKSGGVAQLKVYYINGDLGFDPLGLTPSDAEEFDVLRTKELNNGRLAMLAVAGIVVQELVNGKGVIENLSA